MSFGIHTTGGVLWKRKVHRLMGARNCGELTTVPTSFGFWISRLPFALPPIWPFCWSLLLVEDHFSRRVRGFAVFRKEPTSLEARTIIGRIFALGKPDHLITDLGRQFTCEEFREWCRRRRVKQRFGAVGKSGSIAVIERLIKTVKNEWTRQILVPFGQNDMRRSIGRYLRCYNEERLHETLGGKTPNEMYFDRGPANERTCVEPRVRWPSALRAPCLGCRWTASRADT